MVATALKEAAAVKGAERTDPAHERPSAFSCASACSYRRVSGEIFMLLVLHAHDVHAAVCHYFTLCSHRGYGVLGFTAKTPAL